MIRGLYTGASGMLTQLARYDVVANNLANVSTPGFKRQEAISSAFPTMLLNRIRDSRDSGPKPIGQLGTGSLLVETVTRYEAGTFEETGNPFDLAISGDGYFAIQTDNGVRYTRNGSFRADGSGQLVTSDNLPVLGNDGNPIDAGSGLDPTQVAIFQIPETDLVKEGENLFRLADGATEPEAADGVQAVSGRLEAANVNPVQAMVDMISALRAYEASQKVVQAMDDTLAKAVNEIARR